jgi:hypothetical protein
MMQSVPSTSNISPTPIPLCHPHSPSPAVGGAPPGDNFTISHGSSDIGEVDVFGKGDQAPVVGRVSDSVLEVLNKGFDEIDEMFNKLAACVKMPFHQVSDRYIHLHSGTHGVNIWNTYSMYFTKNMKCELAHLPEDERVDVIGTPMPSVCKCCFTLFKEEYKDMYVMILEMWKEVKELENMGGTIAQWQQLFDRSKKNLNHMVSHYLSTGQILIGYIYFLVHCTQQIPWV